MGLFLNCFLYEKKHFFAMLNLLISEYHMYLIYLGIFISFIGVL